MKDFILKRRGLCVLIIFAVVLVSFGTYLLIKGNDYTLYSSFPDEAVCDSAEVFFGDSLKNTESEIFEVKKTEVHRGYAKAVISAKKNGSEQVALTVHTVLNGSSSTYVTQDRVRAGVIIYNNIRQVLYIVLAFFSLLIAAYYFYLFINSLRHDRYSYNCIFFLSVSLIFILMVIVWLAAAVYSMINYHTMTSQALFTVNENLTLVILLVTLPLTFIFALSVSVSNIQLIRREGMRPANTLGIIVSIMMMLGLFAVIFLVFLNSNSTVKYIPVAYSVVSALYVVFEVVLISTVFCGIYVARFTPAYDKDYIIILGCKIKPDGTLYPLLRGRADGAVKFYKAQLEKTGKKATLIPSGGQGNDEIMSEAEAIKNYLIEQGIPEEQIIPETNSTSTFENMKFSKELMGAENENAKAVFSTTSYHVFRSGIIASSAGLRAEGIGNKTKWYFWPNAFLREVAGLFVSQPKKQIIIMLIIALTAGIGSYAYSLI